MEYDIKKSSYETIDETIDYMYGSAEVIGLYIEYINFIRDIAEDLTLGRIYMPGKEMKKHGITKLDYNYVTKFPKNFINFIHSQLSY